MRIALVVPFLNEEHHLPVFMESIARQSRPADQLLLVDDGSSDRSPELATAFAAEHAYARALRLPRRPRGGDRLSEAAELRAFQRAVPRLEPSWDIIAKLDADLQLTPDVLAGVEQAFAADPRLGVTGPFLSTQSTDGCWRRERCPSYHVRGATKFYRRACWEQIQPLPAILGWDTIDEVAARLHGWRTASFEASGGDTRHLRRTGTVDGRLRAYLRWGACAYAIGDHPLWLALGTARRINERPWLFAGGAYLTGWIRACCRRAPRATPVLRAQVRHEQLARLKLCAPTTKR